METWDIGLVVAYCLTTWIFGIAYACDMANEGDGVRAGDLVVAVLSPIVIIPAMLVACFQIMGETFSEWKVGR